VNDPDDNPYPRLERIFHEPGRLTIMTNLLGAPDGLTFTELKTACNLTDGNLSRHLKVLEKAKAVTAKKRFVKNRPQTTVFLSKDGREDFMAYLQALETVLLDAAAKAATGQQKKVARASLFSNRLAKA
jgi:DNA-binding transcriptional ArsR family regulator